MMRWNRLAFLSVCVLAGTAIGCKSGDDDDDSGGTGGGGGGAGAGSMAAGMGGGDAGGGAGTGMKDCGIKSGSANMCLNEGAVNLDCPEQPPVEGACASSSTCCRRASNKVKNANLCEDESQVLEYRLNFSLTKNHPTTIGDPLLVASSTARYDQEQQSILWTFKTPRKGGMDVAGEGETTIGVGRYNCDGTYSYYNDKAAPADPNVSMDVGRWQKRTVKSVVDPTKQGRDRMKVPFANNRPGRNLVYTPFLDDSGAALDWELVNEGYDILQIDTTGDGMDCIGKRDGTTWSPAGTFEVYTPLPENDKEKITLIMQTYCQLVAFGILPTDKKDTVLCNDMDRCMPGTADCPWKKLPDSLCPFTDAERDLFGCHLGDKDNVNNEEGYPSPDQVKCSMTAPTAPADPDMGDGSRGQCCSPIGDPDSGLPPCNAYRLIQDYVAAAAEITDSLADKVQEKCPQ